MRKRSNFFVGRSGSDALSITLSFLACVLLIVSMFFRNIVSSILWVLALVCLGLSYFRIFSRNVAKRRAENERFLQLVQPITKWVNRQKTKRRQKNLYCFFKCPQCGTVLRVPKGKGRVRITCKACGTVFEKST